MQVAKCPRAEGPKRRRSEGGGEAVNGEKDDKGRPGPGWEVCVHLRLKKAAVISPSSVVR
jgi:hypothetical protein